MEGSGGAKCLSSRTQGLKLSLFPLHRTFITETQTTNTSPPTCSHTTTTTTNFSLALSTLHSSTSWRAPDEKAVRRPESLFLLAQRHATYFPGQWSTFLPHYFSLHTPRFNLASRLAGLWTPAAWHSCRGMYQISQARQRC